MFLVGIVNQLFGIWVRKVCREHTMMVQGASLLTFKGAWSRAFTTTFVIRKSIFFCLCKTELYKKCHRKAKQGKRNDNAFSSLLASISLASGHVFAVCALLLSLLRTTYHLRDIESTTSLLSLLSYPATKPTMPLQGSLTSAGQIRPVPAPRTSSRLPCKNVARTDNVPYGDHCRGGADGSKVVQFFQNVNRAWNSLVSRPLAASAAQECATTRSQRSVRTTDSS